MKYRFLTLSILSLGFFACSDHQHDESCKSHGGHHVHQPLLGGALVPLGEHGGGYNLEVLTTADQFLSVYILDAHAENFVRIAQPKIDLELSDQNQSVILSLDAIADSATGETVGNTSHFRSPTPINSSLPASGILQSIKIGANEYNQTRISFPENPKP